MNLIIIDYGVGNLGSIQNMLKKIGITASISSNESEIALADKIILAGIGAFDACMEKLGASGLTGILNKKVIEDKVPVLGICVGMQMMTAESEEGSLRGLGWIEGKTIRFDAAKLPSSLKVPHMGWSDVAINKSSPLLEKMPEDTRFYFAHSYHASITNNSDILLTATYGYDFTAAIEHENIMGVQFHPEKSHKFGMQLLSNFVNKY